MEVDISAGGDWKDVGGSIIFFQKAGKLCASNEIDDNGPGGDFFDATISIAVVVEFLILFFEPGESAGKHFDHVDEEFVLPFDKFFLFVFDFVFIFLYLQDDGIFFGGSGCDVGPKSFDVDFQVDVDFPQLISFVVNGVDDFLKGLDFGSGVWYFFLIDFDPFLAGLDVGEGDLFFLPELFEFVFELSDLGVVLDDVEFIVLDFGSLLVGVLLQYLDFLLETHDLGFLRLQLPLHRVEGVVGFFQFHNQVLHFLFPLIQFQTVLF